MSRNGGRFQPTCISGWRHVPGRGAEVTVRKVKVEGRLFQIVVTEQHLDGAQVRSRFQQMSGKAMSTMSLKT